MVYGKVISCYLIWEFLMKKKLQEVFYEQCFVTQGRSLSQS